MRTRVIPLVTTILAVTFLVSPSRAATQAVDPDGIERLIVASGGTAEVRLSLATGAARFVSFAPGGLPQQVAATASAEDKATAFFDEHGSIFGIRSAAAELILSENRVDSLGERHLTYEQEYERVPVFGGWLRVHFDSQGSIKAVNGSFIPDIELDPSPRRSADDAGRVALNRVGDLSVGRSDFRGGNDLRVVDTGLTIFRTGLLRGVPGRNYLVWEVEVFNGAQVRELVYVDAHNGKVVDQISLIHEAIDRRIHQLDFGSVIWQEGDPLPFIGSPPDANDDPQIDRIIDTSRDVYDLFRNLSGGSYLSYRGNDNRMNAVFENMDLECPNASWNGRSANFCNGVAGDDTVAHEWTHAYSGATHGLIYQDQAGALSEAYSDIFGEVVDSLNSQGSDSPDAGRSVGECSTLGGNQPPRCTINSPARLAGEVFVSGANFNPQPPITVRGDVELVNDGDTQGGTGTVTDGCQPFVGFTPGSIALVDRGECLFVEKVMHAEEAGAVGVKIVNNVAGLIQMGGTNSGITIPSVMLSMADGAALAAELANETINSTIELPAASRPTVRWMVGEDDTAFGGPIRDMWNPSCFGHPASVTDPRYFCSEDDDGGVHRNSGIPNHEFSLLVDGGTFGGESISALGLTKTAHIFWRAMTVYQGPTTNFAAHADAVEMSCNDLIGTNLTRLDNGAASGSRITEADCREVEQAVVAVDLRDEPTSCVFATVLDPNAPPFLCSDRVFFEDFESDPGSTWTLSNEGVYAEYTPRDWEWAAQTPEGGSGSAFFAIDSLEIGDCVSGSDDQSGVMHLDSPVITLPADSGSSVLTFDHWLATETDYDGGNLKISVNGGAFNRIVSASDFTFNPYTGNLERSDSENANTNPMAGQPAFHGSNRNTLSGSWGQSRVDLSSYADPGDRIQIRFDLGVDGCNGNHGWYVDNVRVCTGASTGPGGFVALPVDPRFFPSSRNAE